MSEGQGLQTPFWGAYPEVQRWPSHLQVRQGCVLGTSVAIDLSEVLHQSRITMVKEILGPLTATEAQAFHHVVGELGISDGVALDYASSAKSSICYNDAH